MDDSTREMNEHICDTFDMIKLQVVKKNIDYGNSLQNPTSIFCKTPIIGIMGRIDDKLNRIKVMGINDKTEDTISDLIGYLVHLKIALIREK
jgi:hypothetical protein